MRFQLEIFHNAATVTFAAELLEEGDGYEIAERATADSVDMSDLTLAIDGDFLGATDIFGVPATDGAGNTDWRARVAAKGVVVLDGIIKRHGGVVYDPDFERWNVTVIQSAPEAFREALKAIPLIAQVDLEAKERQEIHPDLNATATLIVGVTDFDELTRYAYWFNLSDLWDEILTLIPTLTFTAAPLFQYTTKYIDTGMVEQTITRTPAIGINACMFDPVADTADLGALVAVKAVGSLPDMTALEIFEALQAMHAWRVRARFATYPSRSLLVDSLPDTFQTPAAPPALDNRDEKGGRLIFDIEAPEYPDLGIAYKNPIPDEGFYNAGEPVNNPIIDIGLPTSVQRQYFFTQPAELAVYDADNRRFDSDKRPNNDTLITLPFYKTHVSELRVHAGVVPFSVSHPDYTERRVVAGHYWPKEGYRGIGFIAALDSLPTDVFEFHMIINRQVEVSRPATQDEFFNESWPVQFIRRYEMSRAEQYVVQAKFDMFAPSTILPSDFAVGDPAEGVALLSRNWFVEERRYNPTFASVVLTLRSMVGVADDVSGGGVAGGETGLLPPKNLTAVCACTADEFDVDLTWAAPNVGPAPTDYEVESFPFWESGFSPLVIQAGTSYSFTEPASGERGSIFFRIRSRDAAGNVSAWDYWGVECGICGDAPSDPDPENRTGDCYEIVHFQGTILAGQSTVLVTPAIQLSTDLDDSTEVINIFITSADGLDPGTELFISDINKFTIEITLEGGISASPSGATANVDFYGMVMRYRAEEPTCAACWRKDTWHSSSSACAPFAVHTPLFIVAAHLMPKDDGLKIWVVYLAGSPIEYRVAEYTLPIIGGGGNSWAVIETRTTAVGSYGITMDKSVQANNIIYIAGGLWDHDSNPVTALVPSPKLISYNVGSDTWTELADMPGSRMSGLFLTDGDNKLWYLGGFSDAAGNTVEDDVYEYNIALDSWSTLAHVIPAGAGMQDMGGIYRSLEIFIFGGIKDSPAGEHTDEVWSYDFSSWTQEVDLPEEIRYQINGAIGLPGSAGGAIIHLINGRADASPGGRTYNHRFKQAIPVDTTPAPVPTTFSTGGASACHIAGLIYVTGNASGIFYVYVPYEGALNPFDGLPAV